MKTRKLTLCAFAAIAALATACSNDELAGNDTPRKGIVIEATATAPRNGADTRLTHKDNVDNMEIAWAKGDNFTAYASSTNKTSYTILDKDAGTASASFTATWDTEPSESVYVYAIYPINTAEDPAAISLPLTGQDGTLANLDRYNYMTASATYQKDQSLSFSFVHQVAIVKLVMSFPTGVTGSASNIGLKATGLNKSANLNLTDGTFSNKIPGDVTTGANTIAIGADNTLTAYLCVFSGSLTDAKAIAKVGSDDYEADLSNLSVAAGSMYTATVTMKKAADYIEVNGIKVAPGNLVADGDHGAKIGTATDGGLFFQFGSLVGWSGGASGDGTGRGTGNTTPALSIAVRPNGFNGKEGWIETEKIWQGEGTVPFTVKDSGSDNEKAGIGDPCRYYLGDTWRLPTKDEYVELFKNNGYPSTGPWKWEDASKSATNSTKNLTFPASGYRFSSGGSLYNVGTSGSYWSASLYSDSNGHSLYFHSSSVSPSDYEDRASGLPVRCVK